MASVARSTHLTYVYTSPLCACDFLCMHNLVDVCVREQTERRMRTIDIMRVRGSSHSPHSGVWCVYYNMIHVHKVLVKRS